MSADGSLNGGADSPKRQPSGRGLPATGHVSEAGDPKLNQTLDEQSQPSKSPSKESLHAAGPGLRDSAQQRHLSQSHSQEEEMKQALPPTQPMRHQPSEAVASLAPHADVIVEHPGGEDEEERKTGGSPVPRAQRAQPQAPSTQGQSQQLHAASDPSQPTIQAAQQQMAPQYADQQNMQPPTAQTPSAQGASGNATPAGASTIDHDNALPPAGNLNSQSRIKVTLTQEGQKVNIDDGMMDAESAVGQEPGPTLSGGQFAAATGQAR